MVHTNDLNQSSIQYGVKAFTEASLDQLAAQKNPVQIRKTDNKGQGVFTTRLLSKDEVVIIGRPVTRVPNRTWKSLQMDVDTHILMDDPFEYVNHSCDPNCGIQPNRFEGYNLVAMRTIEKGEEITFDYCMTEWLCVGFRNCSCGSDRCRKVVEGAKHLPTEVLMAYQGYLAPYYLDLLPSLRVTKETHPIIR